jgi:hypothetical protein
MIAVAIASGRRNKRVEWIACIAQARKPEELEHIPRKCRNLDYKLAYAALVLWEHNQVLYDKLRRAGKATENKNEMRNGRQCLWCIYAHYAAKHGLRRTKNHVRRRRPDCH